MSARWTHRGKLQSAPEPCAKSRRNIAGATLAIARVGVVHEFETGRDKPVPYNARVGVVQEIETGRDKPVPYNARVGVVQEIETGRDEPVPYNARVGVLQEIETGRGKPVSYRPNLGAALSQKIFRMLASGSGCCSRRSMPSGHVPSGWG